MTKKEAVENHRKMWKWIAEETLKREKKVFKGEYLSLLYNNQYKYDDIHNDCFCCEYVSQFTNDEGFCCEYELQLSDPCSICPITWCGGCCCGENGLYTKFGHANSSKESAEIARIISELPERETNTFDIVEGE